jgi:glycosyltransferase involved in cell wall biosynthesis
MRILYVCDADGGGIAEYAIRQCRALRDEGAEVTVLCRSSFEVGRLAGLAVKPDLPAARARHSFPAQRLFHQILDARSVAGTAAGEAAEGKYDFLLIACYAEYFAPFWAPLLRRAARRGASIGTIAHDPVRDFVLGPAWWHRWSVRQAYSFVSHVFVHDNTSVDFGGPRPEHLATHVIPHGPFEVAAPRKDRAALRRDRGFAESDTVFLAFGQIRDGKNLDRFLRAMKELPESVKLLVAGSGGSGSQRPPEYYKKLAAELGIGDRCIWDLRYVPDEETGDLFEVSDHLLLTYSAKFRSASGVLNTAVSCRKSVLATSGPGPLKTAVEGYSLGVFVAPDEDAVILEGARRLLAEPGRPEWGRYEQENSWEENARRVIDAFGR